MMLIENIYGHGPFHIENQFDFLPNYQQHITCFLTFMYIPEFHHAVTLI